MARHPTIWNRLGRRFSPRVAAGLVCLAATGACASAADFGAVTDPGLLDRASAIAVYTNGESSSAPPVKAVIGPLRADECKYRYNADSVGQQAALSQLKARAALKGANGIVGLTYLKISNTRSPCWHGFEASGVAVIFEASRQG